MTTNEVTPVKILVDSFADDALTNAQMINAREIVSRLDSERFSVAMFVRDVPAPQILARPNTQLIQLPRRLQTLPILTRFLFGSQDMLFYLKASPATQWYFKLRRRNSSRCATIGAIEAQMDFRGEPTSPQMIRLIEETVLRCDHLFSNSANVKRSLEANYGLHSEIVPTGVDTDFFTPDWGRAPNVRPRVLFVGALRNFKGPQVVLDAALLYPQADFVLVGDGVMREELRERANSLSNVELRGTLGRTAIREEYRKADIFMFPSCWEGSPRVLMEAAASGLPVIARKDYRPESVVDGTTGFLAGDDSEIMERLAELIADSDLRRGLGESGRSFIARFSWDVITRQWEEIFTRLAPARGRTRDFDTKQR
jgi:glycosyltransferase involved in cell wall biosynthesis